MEKKKKLRRRERKEGTSSWTGESRKKGWERECDIERKMEKTARESRAEGQQE